MNDPNVPFNANQQMRRGISLNKRQFYVTISHPITERLCRSIINVDGLLVRLDALCARRGISYEKFCELTSVLLDTENVIRDKVTQVYALAGPAGNDLRNRRRKKQGKPVNQNRNAQPGARGNPNTQRKAGPAETGPAQLSSAGTPPHAGSNGATEPKAKATQLLEDDTSLPGFGDSRLPAVSAGPVSLSPQPAVTPSPAEQASDTPAQARSVTSPKRKAVDKEHAARN